MKLTLLLIAIASTVNLTNSGLGANSKKLDLYKKNKLKLENSRVKFFYGLKTDNFQSADFKMFNLDLGLDKIHLNIYPTACDSNIDCQIKSTEPETDSYNGREYQYQSANIFLSWNLIVAGDIKDRDVYNSLRTYEVQNINFDGQTQGEI